ncbi:MAG: hypothetical protein WAW75_08805 [Gallionella sp.]
MAITGIEYNLFRSMREQNTLPIGSDILELGEANWYGDVDLKILVQDINRFAPEEIRQSLIRQLEEITTANRPGVLWEIAKIYWQTFFQPRFMTAIDFHGTEQALKLDLNDPIDLQRQFHVVMNMGTVEHVFNVAQAFKTIHDHTLPSGMMVHGLPFTGWVDHGFYSFNPTFYWDLATINGYEMLIMLYAEINPVKLVKLQNREQILAMAKNGQVGKNALIYVVLRRPAEALPFRVPIQGYYAGAISREAADAWKTLR